MGFLHLFTDTTLLILFLLKGTFFQKNWHLQHLTRQLYIFLLSWKTTSPSWVQFIAFSSRLCFSHRYRNRISCSHTICQDVPFGDDRKCSCGILSWEFHVLTFDEGFHDVFAHALERAEMPILLLMLCVLGEFHFEGVDVSPSLVVGIIVFLVLLEFSPAFVVADKCFCDFVDGDFLLYFFFLYSFYGTTTSFVSCSIIIFHSSSDIGCL